MSVKTEKQAISMDPIEAQAKYNAFEWAMNPKDELQHRTSAKLQNHEGVFAIAYIIEVYDYIEQLLSSEMFLVDLFEQEIVPPPITEPEDDPTGWIEYYRYEQRKKILRFKPNPEQRNEVIHQFVNDFLSLTVALNTKGNHTRAGIMLDTVKGMAKPQQNLLQALGGLLGNKEEKQEGDFAEYPDDDAI